MLFGGGKLDWEPGLSAWGYAHDWEAATPRLRCCMQEAYTKVVTCLVSCPMEDAERYCEALRRKGLSSTIELA